MGRTKGDPFYKEKLVPPLERIVKNPELRKAIENTACAWNMWRLEIILLRKPRRKLNILTSILSSRHLKRNNGGTELKHRKTVLKQKDRSLGKMLTSWRNIQADVKGK